MSSFQYQWLSLGDMLLSAHLARAKRIAGTLAIVIVIAVFASSATAKVNDLLYFSEILYESDILPDKYVRYVTIYIPIMEYCIAVTLLFPAIRRDVLIASFVIIAVFTYLIILLPPSMDCGCFGSVFPMTRKKAVFKNVLVAIAVFIAIWAKAARVGVGKIGLCEEKV